jgi:hypothetical protein
MTQEKFEQARMIKQQIEHITQVIEKLSTHEYRCEPPTRDSGLTLIRGTNCAQVQLNEGEVVYMILTLKSERDRLHEEFQKL